METVLVYGPESSCSRYVARACASILNGNGVVHHATLPNGERDCYPLASEFAPTKIVLTMRDRGPCVASATPKHWLGDRDGAERAYTRATKMMRDALDVAPCFIFQAEAPWEWQMDRLAEFLGYRLPVWIEPWRPTQSSPR